jgi:alanine dehydrogenase
MIIGCPKEIKNHEYRVGLTPAGVQALANAGHAVLIETHAGARVGYPDASYQAAGAAIVATAAEIYRRADMVIKVKELQAVEFALLHAGQILFGYHHFAPEPNLAQAMLDAGVSCIAYETVSDANGGRPLLAPMSKIAGRLAPQVGAWALQMVNGGSGVLLGGVPDEAGLAGVAPAKVTVIGAGTVGSHATQIAVGMGGAVTVLDDTQGPLVALDRIYHGRIKTIISDTAALADHVAEADLVICAALIPGRLAPRLISRELLRAMRPGSVIVDVSIDQGGTSEASRPTSHADPIFIAEGVVHYCVSNIPAAVARTATLALTQATLPYALALANLGLDQALAADSGLAQGLQIHAGKIVHAGLAGDLTPGAASVE